MYGRRNFIERFWAKVDERGPDDCWEWQGARYHDDYGVFGVRNQGRSTTMRAHAVALMFATAEDANGRFALHRCDNPPCVNPAHLYWGDQKANIADMDRRGRANRPRSSGEGHPSAKLTADQVREIRALYWGSGRGRSHRGVTQQELAECYGVSQYSVSQIVRRKSWTDLE